MKKKTRLILTSLSMALGVSFLAAGCGTSVTDNKVNIGDYDYNWGYKPVMSEVCDEGVKIDGVLDESIWENKKYLVHQEDGAKMSYTTAFSEKGLYVAAIAEDEDLQWNATKYYEGNSSFWLSVKGKDVRYKYNTQVFEFFIDGVSATSVQMIKYQAAGKTDKDYAEDPTVLTAELFVTWDTLNIELGENGELPEYVLINPHYRHVEEASSADNAWLRPLLFFDDNDRQQTSGKFDKDGYINADADDAIIGNAGNGMAKSDGWDITRESEGIVRSTVDHSQAIFFKDIYSKAYAFEVTATVKGGLGYWSENGYPTNNPKPASTFGIVNMVDEISFNTFLLDAAAVQGSSVTSNYKTLSFWVNGRGGWRNVELGTTSLSYETPSTVTFTCIKNGANFYYIVNGSILYTEYVSYLNGASCPGFFAIDSEVEYTNYSAIDFSDDPEGLVAYLEKYGCYMVDVETEIEGGSLMASSGAVDEGGSVEVTVSPESGYLLTGFTVNGVDIYDEYMANAENGVYTFKNVNESILIGAEFTRLKNDLMVYVRGYVKDETNNPIGHAQVSVDDLAGMYHIEAGVSSMGMYRIGLPKTGEFELGGRRFNFSGEYVVAARADGYHGLGKYITIPVGGEDIKDFNFEINEVKGSEVQTYTDPEGEKYYSPNFGWMNYNATYVNPSKMTDTAVFKVEVTAEKGIQFAEWGWTGVGIVVSNGQKVTGKNYYDYGGTKRTVPANNYYNALFGFDTTTGIIMYSGFNMNMTNNINRNVKIPSPESPTKTLTLLLKSNKFYLFMEDQYMGAWALDSDAFAPHNKNENNSVNNATECAFKNGDKFMFGVGAFNLSATTPVTIHVLQELYDEEARGEMESNDLYRDALRPTKQQLTENSDGSYSFPVGWQSYGYYYTTKEASNAAVYSVKVKGEFGLDPAEGIWHAIAGITVSNETIIKESSYIDYINTERKINTETYYGSTFGIGNDYGFSIFSGRNMRVYPVTERTYAGLNLSATQTERTLTLLLFEDNFYMFIDGQFIAKVAVDDDNLRATEKNQLDSGNNYGYQKGDKFIFGISSFSVSGNTPLTFTIEEELYGEEALQEIASNETYQNGIYYDPWKNPEPIESKGFTEENGVWTPAVTATGWGYNATNWHYFEEMSDTVVFSLDVDMINLPDLAAQFPDLNCGRYGITFTNGELLKASYASYTAPGEYASSQIALFGNSLCTVYDTYRNKARDKASVPGYEPKSPAFSVEKTKANLTVVLYKDTLYAYVDGVFTYSWAITDPLLGGDYSYDGKVVRSAYTKGDTYKFGLMTNGTQDEFKSAISNVKRFYGADALNELKTNTMYENIGLSVASKNITTASEGVYNAPQGWQSYGYKYTTKTPQTTAIYQVKVTGKNGFLHGSAYKTTSVGITATNGQFVDEKDYSFVAYDGNTRTIFSDSYYGTCFGLTGDRNYVTTSGKYMAWSGPVVFAKDKMITAENPTRTLTLVLYQNKFHFYIDSKLMESTPITDTKFQPKNAQPSGKTYAYKEGDGFLFGISSYNLADGTQTEGVDKNTPATFSDIVELYGAEALLELQTNEKYAAVGAVAETTEVSALEDSLNGVVLSKEIYM